MGWGFSDILAGVGLLNDLTGGGKKENGGAGTQSATRDPWGPAQPYILRGLSDTSALNNYYQQNPFSDLQKHYYGQQFADIDNFRNTVAPGLMSFANAGMTGGYHRGGSVIPQRGYFSVANTPTGTTGINQSVPTVDPFASVFKPSDISPQSASYAKNPVTYNFGGGGHSTSGGKAGNGTNFTDAQWATIKQMNDESGFFNNPVNQIGLGALVSSLSPTIAGLLGFPAGDPMTAQARSEQAIAQRDAFNNPIGYDTPEGQSLASGYAQYRASRGGGGDGGGGGGGGGAATGGSNGDASGGGDRGTRGGFANGGFVTKGLLSGPDPKGPDDGSAYLDEGEYVIKKSAVKKIGKKKLDKMNKG